MSVAPKDLAASRFRPIRHAQEQTAKATAAHAEAVTRLEQLRADVGPAERRDREALGRALVNDKAEPASEAAKLKAEIERQENRVEALVHQVAGAQSRVGELVTENRVAWRTQAMRELSRALRRYKEAIVELEAGRDALSDEASLVAWLDGGAGATAASDPLGGRIGSDARGRPALSFARTLEELRADADAIAAYPVDRDDPVAAPRRELMWRG